MCEEAPSSCRVCLLSVAEEMKSVGDFTFWISLSLSKRLSETVNLSPKIRSKTEVWIRFQLRLSLSEKIISRL